MIETEILTAQTSSFLGPQFILLLGFIAVMYFLIIRPQNKRAKEHNKLIDSLTNGTEVVVSNGIMGKIVGIKDDTIDLEISKGINIKVRKNSVSTVLPKGSI